MNRTLLAASVFALVAVSSFAHAQALPAVDQAKPSSFSAQYAFDPTQHGKPIQVISYTAKTFDDVFGKQGASLDLRALLGVQTHVTLGTALTHTFSFKLNLARGYQPKIDLSVGPWINYGLGEKKLRGGLFLGVGGSF